MNNVIKKLINAVADNTPIHWPTIEKEMKALIFSPRELRYITAIRMLDEINHFEVPNDQERIAGETSRN